MYRVRSLSIIAIVLQDICTIVSMHDVSCTVSRDLHIELNNFVDAVLSKDNLHLDTCSFLLFEILLSIAAMTTEQDIRDEVIIADAPKEI